MDTKIKICLILTTFFVLSLFSHFVIKAQADWYNDHGPVSTPPEPIRPSPIDCSTITIDGSPIPPTVTEIAIVIAVCANAGDPTSACLGESVDRASQYLVTMFASTYLNSYLGYTVKLMIPAIYPQYQAIQLLYFIEIRAINTTQAKLENDLRRLRAFEWPTEAEKERALTIIQNDENTINKWNREAREEANNHANWTHRWNDDGNEYSTHEFHFGPAYEQLKNISSLGWLVRPVPPSHIWIE
jgi:hypothetical protein